MTWKHIFKTSLTGLTTNRSRSLLTILGIVIGITAIMLVVSLGAGAQELILGQIQGLGTNTIIVVPGREPTGPADSAQMYSDSLRDRDIVELEKRANVPGMKVLMPFVAGADSASYGSEVYPVAIYGATELVVDIFDSKIDEGYAFTDDDVASRADVAIIGSKVAEHLFEDDSAIGKRLKLKGRNLKVTAVLEKAGGGSLFSMDEAVIVPYTTAMDYMLGIKYYHHFIIQAEPDDQVGAVAEDVRITLRDSHGITDPSKDDFYVQTQEDLAKRLSTITGALTYFLVAVASIALFVGGVGIMNIMLVAVTERTREIGLRKALGAKDSDILSQFLIEAVLLTLMGGLIGIVLGSSMAYLISIVLSQGLGVDWSFVFPWDGALMGFAVSAAIGLIFGGYPARQASKKSPIEALRYE